MAPPMSTLICTCHAGAGIPPTADGTNMPDDPYCGGVAGRGDIGSPNGQAVTGAEECEQQCLSRTGCVAWSLWWPSNKCWLKADIGSIGSPCSCETANRTCTYGRRATVWDGEA